MSTGERIKSRRKQLSISADVLAERVGVSRATVFRWERGEIEKVDAKVLNKVAVALNTTSKYLLGLSDNPDEVEIIEPLEDGVDSGPRTRQARIISHGIDAMPPAERDRAVDMFKLVFAAYADKFNDEGD